MRAHKSNTKFSNIFIDKKYIHTNKNNLLNGFSGSCQPVDCTTDGPEPKDEEGSVTTSTGIFVLDPNDSAGKYWDSSTN